MTTPFIYPCLSPLKCHQDIVLWILINCGWLQEASAELRGLTSEFPGVAAAVPRGVTWRRTPRRRRTNCTLDAACYFPILLLCCFPAQPLLCRSQSLLCMFRVDIYLLIYVKRTCQLGVEKSWNATRPHQTSAKAKKSTCKKNEINTHTSTVTVFSKRSVLQNQDLVLLPEIVMQAVISPRRG